MRHTIGISLAALALTSAAPGSARAADAASDPARLQRPNLLEVIGLEAGRGLSLTLPASFDLRGEGLQDFAVDRDGSRFSSWPAISPELRLGLRFDSRDTWAPFKVSAAYGHDLVVTQRAPTSTLRGLGYPSQQALTSSLREAWAQLAMDRWVFLRGGFMMSHWGLGLVANAGDATWELGTARFADPRGGDRVLRGMIGTGPLSDLFAVALLAVDSIVDDDVVLDTPEVAPGRDRDQAWQVVGALKIGGDVEQTGGGVYVVRRAQRSDDARRLDAWVVDLVGHGAFPTDYGIVRLAAEAAYITGETTLAASPDNPVQRLAQVGATARLSLHRPTWAALLDLLYCSGDRNLDDGWQNGFKADPNFEMGMFLYRYVLAAQTARAAGTATDPALVGRPSAGFERIPTRGGATNTVAFFPRLSWRPRRALEVYGGPLLAFTEVETADPYNTRRNGGLPRNALGGDPGRFLGAELDLGAAYQTPLWVGRLTTAVEGAGFFPGDALVDATGATPPALWGGRVRAQIAF